MGFILTTEGIRPDPEKLKAIQEFPTPRNIKQFRAFLGLINFYSKFNQQHAKKTVPLLALIKKRVKLKWNAEKQKSFKQMKDLFCPSSLLYFPNPKEKFYLETDASDYALGAILYQKNENEDREVISLAIQSLKGA